MKKCSKCGKFMRLTPHDQSHLTNASLPIPKDARIKMCINCENSTFHRVIKERVVKTWYYCNHPKMRISIPYNWICEHFEPLKVDTL